MIFIVLHDIFIFENKCLFLFKMDFIEYLLRKGKYFDINYIGTKDRLRHYMKKFNKKFNLEPLTFDNILKVGDENKFIVDNRLEINHHFINSDSKELVDEYFRRLEKSITSIKNIKKNYTIISTSLVFETKRHAILIVYYRDEDMFYICDSDKVEPHSVYMLEIYNRIFDERKYEIVHCQFQTIEESIEKETNGYCFAWSMLLAYCIIKFNNITIEEIVERITWSLDYNPNKMKQLIHGFVSYMESQ